MGGVREVELGETFEPFALFRQQLGFIPNLFRAQTPLPRAIEAEARVVGTVLLQEVGLSRIQKELILLVVAAAKANTYCVTAHWEMLHGLGLPARQLDRVLLDHRHAGLAPADVALLDFGLKLSQHPTWIRREDIEALRRHAFTDGQILEAVLMPALTNFVCALSEGLDVTPDFEPKKLPAARRPRNAGPVPRATPPQGLAVGNRGGAYLPAVEMSAETFAPFALFRERFGFIPNIFRAQTLRPDVVEAEAEMVRTILLTEDVLSRVQKEYILLVVSAANLNTYCVAVHCEMLRGLGIPEDVADRVAVDHRHAGLSPADVALLDAALKLTRRPTDFDAEDLDGLRRHGFTDPQVVEAIVMTALSNFLNTLQMGLGTVPDFAPRLRFPEEAWPEPSPAAAPGAAEQAVADAALVSRVRAGDLAAFEDLARRHTSRVYRTLLGITGSPEDAEDGTQEVFLKVFRHVGRFQGAATFTTWLTRIAINEGLQRLRRRRRLESLSDRGLGNDLLRPRQVEAWEENPEQAYSRKQLREMVERGLMTLPPGYRVVVILRDLEGLSTEEAAAALGVPVTTLKSRLLRGRLMLREALAPHFGSRGKARNGRA